MKEWNNDKELISLIKGELYTAVIGDIMDKMGYLHQFLPQQIRALREDMFVVGRAMTVLEADVYENQTAGGMNPILKRSFGLMLEALDDLKEGETSDVIETDSALYIVRLDSETDKDATEKNRQNIIDKRKSDHYNEVLEGWQKKDGWKVNKKNVAKISFKNSLTQQDPNASTETQTSTETQNVESTQ